ncbi:MAG: DUF1499 domain-containing protein [Planctomycetaceae bacterium]|nr:DUF1499 domain-containing protein [Planctomycetaceae bacterium]
MAWIVGLVIVVAAGWGGIVLWARSAATVARGVQEGSLAECPASPNCVCSQSKSSLHQIEGLQFEGDAESAWARVRQLLNELPEARLVSESDKYLHYEFRSKIIGYVDDVELLKPTEGNRQIDIRSASRVGYSDMGVNRKRMERIRELFQASPPAQR